jgi:hypothetical protein
LRTTGNRRLTGRRRVLASLSLGLLALSQVIIGGWALFAPVSFYAGFPAAGHAWVALLPPYNEHLVRDVGALSLALAVVLVVAAGSGRSLVIRTATAAFAVYAAPHTVFHARHLAGFSAPDATAQMIGLGVQLLLTATALICTFGGQESGSSQPEPRVGR